MIFETNSLFLSPERWTMLLYSHNQFFAVNFRNRVTPKVKSCPCGTLRVASENAVNATTCFDSAQEEKTWEQWYITAPSAVRVFWLSRFRLHSLETQYRGGSGFAMRRSVNSLLDIDLFHYISFLFYLTYFFNFRFGFRRRENPFCVTLPSLRLIFFLTYEHTVGTFLEH